MPVVLITPIVHSCCTTATLCSSVCDVMLLQSANYSLVPHPPYATASCNILCPKCLCTSFTTVHCHWSFCSLSLCVAKAFGFSFHCFIPHLVSHPCESLVFSSLTLLSDCLMSASMGGS
uniref:Secreted protein n=1 Tax=Lutzomyia longipalpis TaxID=7200 RepID=A0A7G3B8P0_LUTLO